MTRSNVGQWTDQEPATFFAPMHKPFILHRRRSVLSLEAEPDKVQLHFCSGLINSRGKHDREGARRDFDKFLERVPAGAFPEAVAMAKAELNAIEGRGGLAAALLRPRLGNRNPKRGKKGRKRS
jgi:hypothetical protein